jgi:mycothiol synthase
MGDYSFRPFAGPSDYPKMLAVLKASKAADGLDGGDTLEGLVERYAHVSERELACDMIMAASEAQLVGYGRTFTEKEADAPTWLYNHRAYVRPDWRRRGLGRALLLWLEQRAEAMAREQAQPAEAGPRRLHPGAALL